MNPRAFTQTIPTVFRLSIVACCFCLTELFLAVGFLQADDYSRDVEVIDDVLGCADRFGNGGFAVALIDDVRISDLSLPVSARFNTKQSYYNESCLGHGWWLPILESTVVQMRESAVIAHLPDGSHKFLYMAFDDGSKFVSRDHQWSGEMKDDKFMIHAPGKFNYVFKRGRLQEMKSPDGEVFRWSSTPTEVKVISSKTGEVLSASLNESGHLKSLKAGSTKLDMNYQQIPVVSSAGGINVVSLIRPSLAVVTSSARAILKCEYQMDDSHGRVRIKAAQLGREIADFSWDMGTGRLLEEKGTTYELSSAGDGVPLNRLAKHYADGTFEAMAWHENRGEWEHWNRDGSHRHLYSAMTPGPAYEAVRKITEDSRDGSRTLYEAYFGVEGEVLREIRERAWGADVVMREGDRKVIRPRITNSAYALRENTEFVELSLSGSGVPFLRYHKTNPMVERYCGGGHWKRFALDEDGNMQATGDFFAPVDKDTPLSLSELVVEPSPPK